MVVVAVVGLLVYVMVETKFYYNRGYIVRLYSVFRTDEVQN